MMKLAMIENPIRIADAWRKARWRADSFFIGYLKPL